MRLRVGVPVLSAVSMLCGLAACGGDGGARKPSARAPAPAPPPRISDEEGRALCLKDRVRRRECTDAYMPAWVGWMVEADAPVGIAADDAELGRPALLAKWMGFWKESYGTDEWFAGECKEQLYEMDWPAIAEKERACLAAPSCEAFVPCIEPLERAALAADHETGTAGAD